jgi:hypothetical protein
VFRRAWELFGGRESLGLPLSSAFERMPDRRVVQYFEGAVLEFYPEAMGDRNKVPEVERILSGVKPVELGSAYAGGRPLPAPQPPQGPFLEFYNRINGDWRLGSPISAELTEDIGGVPTRVQYFQKGRLELNPATQTVGVGSLGKSAWEARCAVAGR